MLKISIGPWILAGTLLTAVIGAPTAHGQALPAATARGGEIQVGGGVTYGKPDFGQDWIGGISVFGDYDLFNHVGVEANGHFTTLHTPQDLGEQTYEAGPRISFRKYRFELYGKAQIGYGRFIVQEVNGTYNAGKANASSYMYSFGGGVDFHASRRISVRVFDLEYQNWPNFLNHGLTPVLGTVGVAYRFR